MVNRKIEKKEYVSFNGCKHFLYHRGNNIENPVMIFLHGGPGSSELVFAHAFQEKWEEAFTVVHYDQRGAGKTYLKNRNLPKPQFKNLLSDLESIVEYVKREYKQQKVVIFGHSFGSLLGSIYVKKYPENILAYIGTGQFINCMENESVGLEKLKEVVKESGNKKDLVKLDKFGNFPYEDFSRNIGKVRRLQGKYKLSTGGIREIKLAFKSGMFGLSGIYAMIKGMNVNSEIIKELMSISLDEEGYDYEIPIFYILGENDWQTPSSIAKKYFDKIKAPYKGLYMLENAAHFTMLDNKEGFENILVDNIIKYIK